MGSGKVYCPAESVRPVPRESYALIKGQNLGGHPERTVVEWPKREALPLMVPEVEPRMPLVWR